MVTNNKLNNVLLSENELKQIEIIKKKRGRKSKKEKELLDKYKLYKEQNGIPETNIKVPKKRGRKPKGGKIIKNTSNSLEQVIEKKTNIILHLKCDDVDFVQNNLISEINYNPTIEPIKAFDEKENTFTDQYYNIEIDSNKIYNDSQNIVQKTYIDNNKLGSIIFKNKQTTDSSITNNNQYEKGIEKNNEIDKQELWNKLKELQYKLHTNNISDKTSNCFRCTCSFDGPPVYIPKCELNGIIEVYGCFCEPECAAGYLFSEPIDNSTKWERYSLLNNLYKKIYNYKKSIKPAPSPYYILDKYYGNLSIDEYRKLLKDESVLIIVDKPLTRVMPEIYQDNNEIPNLSFHTENKKNYRLFRKKK